MNRYVDVKHEEDPLTRTEMKTEPQVCYKFLNLCLLFSLHKTGDQYIETHFHCCFTGHAE